MFSGIIQCTGTVIDVVQHGTTRSATLSSPIADEVKIDQSISHDGVCLTVVGIQDGTHTVDIVEETQSKTTFQNLKPGRIINLERSISLSTLLDGHLVQGHVDTTVQCLDRMDLNGSWKFRFDLPKEFAGLIIPHGSICLNGGF